VARAQQEAPAKAEEQRAGNGYYSTYGNVQPAQEGYQGAWKATELQRAVELWKTICADRPQDVNAQFNLFRSERNARMENNNGRLDAGDERELKDIAERIQSTAPNSFEQHMADYYVSFPSDKADVELDQAKALGPDRPEVILPALDRANAEGDLAGLDRWCLALEQRGGLAPALAIVARDLLKSVADDGIVFANGDMDVAPALVQQRLHAVRRDVLVIDQRLLADAGYRQRMWSTARAQGPVPASGPAFAKALHGATSRPVHLALSLDRAWFDAFPGQLCNVGITFALCPARVTDFEELEQGWKRLERTADAGPLSRNYLLPGSMLLGFYRSLDAEGDAAVLELELRRIATATGAMQDLYKAGVLQH
jgi:hypothetical protein